MSYRTSEHVVFIPNGDSRRDTAQLLIGVADEYGIDPSAVFAEREGFSITEELQDALTKAYDEYDEADDEELEEESESDQTDGTEEGTVEEDETKPEAEPDTKTSGNRAAKKSTDKE
jgi:hypothetical protein